jgi:hypothetical protein
MRMSQRAEKRVEPPQNFTGHSMYCSKCRTFKVHSFELAGNGTPELVRQCRACRTTTRFEFVAGGWIPESFVRTLEDFTGALIEREVTSIQEDFTEVNKILLDPKATKKAFFTRRQRAREWMTCKRFLLTIVIPVGAPLATMTALGVLVHQGIRVQPIADLVTPIWQQWMNSISITVAALIGVVALVAAYVRCRLANRIRAHDEPSTIHIEDECSILEEMEEF